MIISGEFFTNRNTGETTLKVTKYLHKLDNNEPIIQIDNFSLKKWSDISVVIDNVIDGIIDNYGFIKNIYTDNNKHKKSLPDINKPIIMNYYVYSQEDIAIVVKKLDKVKNINSFSLKPYKGTKYKIVIFTKANEQDLAEEMFLNGLSYKKHNNLYNLINIRHGG